MGRYSKWIGGALGWAFAGPIGGLVGFAIGSLMGSGSGDRQSEEQYRQEYVPNDFAASLLVLTAAMMKADGRVVKAELDFVKEFFKQQFGVERTKKEMLVLRELLKKPIPVSQVCIQIRSNMSHANRLQLMHYLIGIAISDGEMEESEMKMLRSIASYLRINPYDLESLLATYSLNKKAAPESAYKVLEIQPTASDEEVKKAYRKMAAKYHPDKVNDLGEEFRKAAEEKFKSVQTAYDTIKKERGIR
jgi:DnaJ like chaperone protein